MTEAYTADTQEMVGSEPSLRSSSACTTQEMVGSELSLRSTDSSKQPIDSSSRSMADTTGPQRYPRRERRSPDFYQAGS